MQRGTQSPAVRYRERLTAKSTSQAEADRPRPTKHTSFRAKKRSSLLYFVDEPAVMMAFGLLFAVQLSAFQPAYPPAVAASIQKWDLPTLRQQVCGPLKKTAAHPQLCPRPVCHKVVAFMREANDRHLCPAVPHRPSLHVPINSTVFLPPPVTLPPRSDKTEACEAIGNLPG
jgi:hypothetical protein